MLFHQIPEDVLQTICNYTNPVDIVNLSRTCRRVHGALTDDTVWKNLCARCFFVRSEDDVSWQKCFARNTLRFLSGEWFTSDMKLRFDFDEAGVPDMPFIAVIHEEEEASVVANTVRKGDFLMEVTEHGQRIETTYYQVNAFDSCSDSCVGKHCPFLNKRNRPFLLISRKPGGPIFDFFLACRQQKQCMQVSTQGGRMINDMTEVQNMMKQKLHELLESGAF